MFVLQVDSAYSRGDVQKAESASDCARNWNFAGIVIGVVVGVVVIIVNVIRLAHNNKH